MKGLVLDQEIELPDSKVAKLRRKELFKDHKNLPREGREILCIWPKYNKYSYGMTKRNGKYIINIYLN